MFVWKVLQHLDHVLQYPILLLNGSFVDALLSHSVEGAFLKNRQSCRECASRSVYTSIATIHQRHGSYNYCMWYKNIKDVK